MEGKAAEEDGGAGGGSGKDGGCEKSRVRTRSIGLMVRVTW